MTALAHLAPDPVHGHGWNSAGRWGGWSWNEPSRGEHFRRCSFCGSIHPEALAAERAMTADRCTICDIEGWGAHFEADHDHPYTPDGWRAEWADRKYGFPHKFYVDIPNRDAGALFVIGSQSGPARQPESGGLDWVAWADLTRAQRKIAKRDGYDGKEHPNYVGFGTRPSHHAKFYTVHLADPAVNQDVKDTIQRVSGLRFNFTDDGGVGWEPA